MGIDQLPRNNFERELIVPLAGSALDALSTRLSPLGWRCRLVERTTGRLLLSSADDDDDAFLGSGGGE